MHTEEQKKMYDRLLSSFEQNFDISSTDKEHFMETFNVLADALCVLNIEDIFVDVGRKIDIIDFNLTLSRGLFLSVAKHTYNDTDEVMFSIAREHKTLIIDEIPLPDLIVNLKKISTYIH